LSTAQLRYLNAIKNFIRPAFYSHDSSRLTVTAINFSIPSADGMIKHKNVARKAEKTRKK
jgi:hypothetical protein